MEKLLEAAYELLEEWNTYSSYAIRIANGTIDQYESGVHYNIPVDIILERVSLKIDECVKYLEYRVPKDIRISYIPFPCITIEGKSVWSDADFSSASPSQKNKWGEQAEEQAIDMRERINKIIRYCKSLEDEHEAYEAPKPKGKLYTRLEIAELCRPTREEAVSLKQSWDKVEEKAKRNNKFFYPEKRYKTPKHKRAISHNKKSIPDFLSRALDNRTINQNEYETALDNLQ